MFSDDDIDGNSLMSKGNNGSAANHNTNMDALNDLDGEENALHEFDFLSGETTNIHQSKSNGLKLSKQKKNQQSNSTI